MYHDTIILALSLISLTLEIKDLDRAILTGDEEPLILPLEFHGNGVARQPIEGQILVV